MKKFNMDEFIWFIIQLTLIILMIYLKVSGKITYFISSKMMIYFNMSIIILMLYALAQSRKIFTVRNRNYITNKFYPILSVIVLCAVFLYVMPNYKSLKAVENNVSMLDENIYEGMIKVTNDNYEILYNMDEYNNSIIELTGFVYETNNDNEIILGREVVSCCQSDKSLIQIKVKGINNINKGTWVKVIGKVEYIDETYLECIEYEKIDEPIEIYFHEKL
ncbi:hypothetical protein LQE93_00080 [Clostridium sp. NSJ-145]|uniref:TIGR03943 family putative permease subunit n=1 Tax=Clostridium sp. NSJ-145 TaxID=2897777 RepID=UPI001E5D4264|nr:hypothetical protein [Clostridium sp. NSJ-145]MCD2500169.1 hypothetical protein [Clostridium sp. NSJ-145]